MEFLIDELNPCGKNPRLGDWIPMQCQCKCQRAKTEFFFSFLTEGETGKR